MTQRSRRQSTLYQFALDISQRLGTAGPVITVEFGKPVGRGYRKDSYPHEAPRGEPGDGHQDGRESGQARAPTLEVFGGIMIEPTQADLKVACFAAKEQIYYVAANAASTRSPWSGRMQRTSCVQYRNGRWPQSRRLLA